MKKQATKAQRKEVNNKCELLQQQLASKQQLEIDQLQSENNNNDGEAPQVHDDEHDVTPESLLAQLTLEQDKPTTVSNTPTPAPTKKRRNRQREKLAKRDKEIAQMKEQARLEASNQPNLQQLEKESLDQLCSIMNLTPFHIKPDGHCLFASILDQLKYRHHGHDSNVTAAANYDIYKLRSLACDYIDSNKDDFLPFLMDHDGNMVQDLHSYLHEMKTSAKWGGELEILALAKVFDCPIKIIISGRPEHVVNEGGKLPPLRLVYYKHAYALGEHYDSLHDVPSSSSSLTSNI